MIAVCAVIACAESWDDMALYGRSKLACPQTEHLSRLRQLMIYIRQLSF